MKRLKMPTTDVWLAVGAGVALIGAGIYFLSQSPGGSTPTTTGTGALPPNAQPRAIPVAYTATIS